MSGMRTAAQKALEALEKAGADKAEVMVRSTHRDELNVESGQFSLLRTTEDISLSLTGIVDDREGSVSVNRIDDDFIEEAAARTVEMARSSQPDEANDISTGPGGASFEKSFQKGPEAPEMELMYSRMKDFLSYTHSSYPTLILEQVILDFTSVTKHYLNTNGVDLRSRRGLYSFSPMFTSKEGRDISSFNYSGVSMASLDMDLQEYGSIDTLLRQSTEQVRPMEFRDKFRGDVIITPDCLESFVYMICMYLEDYPMIKGTSIFKDSLGSGIAAENLTLRCMPGSEELAGGYFITSDGFQARDSIVIESGVLRSFLLSLYGSKKTGLERAVNSGGAFVIDPGNVSLEEMIGSVERGIMLCRFSGGMPSESGDFSGIAKNSYYIENGKVKAPVKEIMISGNLKDLLMEIRDVSEERINSGDSIYPWIRIGGISIFGK